jgi:hypothetical protein
MDLSRLAFPAVILLGISSVTLFLSRSWRWRIGALAFQYLGVFILISLSWPTDLAAVKLVIGWMAGAILGVSRIDLVQEDVRRWPTERLYFIFVASVVFLTVATIAPNMANWVPGVEINQAWGGMLLIGMGLIHMGLSARGLRVIISLLTFLSGFEILYAVVESSTLVTGLLALVNLGVAIAGAYLMTDASSGEEVV